MLGLVVDPDGRPVASAAVACEEHEPHFNASTDDQGRFSLSPDAAGCGAVASLAAFQPSEPTKLSAQRVNVLRLRQGGSLEGDVVDEQGRPVAQYVLAVESFLPAAGVALAVPGGSKNVDDAQGAFAWTNLAPGSYVLTASATGRPPARSPPTAVEMAQATRNVRIVLARGATLSGRVLDADSRKAVQGATIALDALTTTAANAIPAAQSDANGAYALDGAPPGPFSVRVTHPSYRSRILAGLTTRGSPTVQQDIELHTLVDGGGREEYTGIGAVLSPSPKGVVVASVVAGGPAERAALQAGDRVVRIDGADATAFPMTACIQALRGAEGSVVTLRVERDGRETEMSIVRKSFAR